MVPSRATDPPMGQDLLPEGSLLSECRGFFVSGRSKGWSNFRTPLQFQRFLPLHLCTCREGQPKRRHGRAQILKLAFYRNWRLFPSRARCSTLATPATPNAALG